MVQQEAVVVRNAVKRYGKKQLVLDRLNMTVSRGSIYGLLGASGCGKTTLLSCVVGVRHLDSGEVWVLGGNPGDKGSGIPGPRVGYMPQEISLVGEFSVSGALYYFGRINGLDDEEIEIRQKFFMELLQLPPANRLVKNMSGGQQRRVSLAAAILHKPELLILDEPTVGLDPILRENIWTYLIQITQEEGVTVLITTHYIEETKDASRIGLMRCGQLLAESSPQKLLERFQCSFLEEAFLKLCQSQNNTITSNEFNVEDAGSDDLYQEQNKYEQAKAISEYKAVSERQVSRARRFKALLFKNGIQFLRYYGGLVFAVLFPILQVAVFVVGVDHELKGKIGVVNDEAGNCDFNNNFGNIWNDEFTCHFSNLSCKFLHNFDDSITIEDYDNISEATNDVQNGKLSGVIYFSQNFSKALQTRTEKMPNVADSDLVASEIQVFLDMGDRQIGLFMQKMLFDRFFMIFEDIMKNCNYSSKLADPPVRIEDPIYGTMDLNYADFMAPVYILTLMFFLATTVSTTLIITDRLEGVWNRSVVQGVKTEEILLSHILIQSIIIVIHAIMIMFLVFVVWRLECKGSIFAATGFTFLVGFCGLMYGFTISVWCKNHTAAHYCSAGSFFPLIVLNGCIWPLEGMPKALRWLSYALPTTLPSESMRGILYKGYSMSDSQVYIGFIISIAWILLYFVIIFLGLRSKSS
ncbi:PREDICTED: ABC transporter G family member 20-like isoform X2 [Wasmannia auropunctata]|nr:PREDICTED: ABC transporter G family member 20-like isoform X2 [Wasmannia auropunctata]XP_011700770.1 PREDICTED: ABC transporter G family member 20-like isoform X2 [Wasmannia auropunctata]XP_011700771.1 PREDICTED: ABC transporter G family member 20-like isoform X2 [Wasmannia auropunctata]